MTRTTTIFALSLLFMALGGFDIDISVDSYDYGSASTTDN